MDLLHRLRLGLATWRRERETRDELARLGDRDLADLGRSRAGFRHLPRVTARQGPLGAFTTDACVA